MELVFYGIATVGFLVFLGVTAVYDEAAARKNRLREEAFAGAARLLGLKYVSAGSRSLVGELDGFDVMLETYEDGTRARSRLVTRVVVGARGRIPPQIAIDAEPAGEALRKALGKTDLQLGEPEFDRVVRLGGPEEALLATLGGSTRDKVLELVRGGGSVTDGELHWLRDGELTEEKVLEEAVRAAVKAAQALLVYSVPAALRANAASEADPKLRLRNLEALVAKFAGTPDAQQALRAGLADRDPEVRLHAARRSPARPEVGAVLEEIVSDGGVPGQVRSRALELLAQAYPYASFAALVKSALRDDSPDLRRAAVEAAATGRDASLLEELLGKIEGADEPMALALAGAFAAIPGSTAEDGLLSLLRAPSAAVRRKAAVGLGKVGTVRAVEPLLSLAEGSADAGPTDAARDAIRAIQSRLGDVGAGRLSVVDAGRTEGALSVDPGKVRV